MNVAEDLRASLQDILVGGSILREKFGYTHRRNFWNSRKIEK